MTPDLTYAIGDIHGCAYQLQKLLEGIAVHAAGREHLIITLGDYIDRGPDSRTVLEILMQRKDIKKLKGNHEEMMMDARRGGYSDLNFWCRNGGMATLRSFETESPRDIPLFYTDFVDTLPIYHEDDLRVFVHAGVNPNQPDMSKQHEHFMIWVRDEFLNIQEPHFKYVVHGHTPQISGEPDVRRNRTNVDTYCFNSGILTCAVFDNKRPEPFEVLQAGANGEVVRFAVNR